MDESFVPKGIPSLTYVRILAPVSDSGENVVSTDLMTEGNTVTVAEAGKSATRHDVAQVSSIYCCIFGVVILSVFLLS